jgi:hypothetical protein
MNILKSVLLTCAFSTAIVGAVNAADMAVEQSPVVAPSASGFYVGSLSTVSFLDDTSFFSSRELYLHGL